MIAHDFNQAGNLLHGKDEFVFGDASYRGIHKREELAGVKVEWTIVERPGKVKLLKKHPHQNKGVMLFERLKASIRAKVEHPFRLRHKGLMKNENQLAILFTLANLFRVDQLIRAQERST